MRTPCSAHRVIAADAFVVPKPFRSFAVRSEELRHAFDARAPYGRVHAVQTHFLDAATRQRLAAKGQALTQANAFSDIAHARVTLDELAAAAPHVPDLAGQLAAALQLTGVLGPDITAYQRSLALRVDFLGTCGAGFHNDVSRHWPSCLFWNLVLMATDVELVMPHAGVRLALAPGDLIVFDPTLAHGLCRPGDQGQAVASSFDRGEHRQQVFLTGELALADTQWAALGSPWLPVEAHAQRGALDLMVASFDERSGTVQRVRSLLQCMQRNSQPATAD